MAESMSVEAVLKAVDDNFTATMEQAVQSLSEVAKSNSNMNSQVTSSNSQTESSSHRLTGGFMEMAKAMGAVAVAAKAFDVVRDSIGGAISRFDTLNNSVRTFNNMGFGTQEVNKSMSGLKQSIEGLPTSLDQAVQGVQMIAASTGNLQQSQKVYSALNDSIIGFGGSTADVNNAVIQLSQAFANGKVDGMTWISMMNSNMGPVLNAIAKKMGITTAALKDGLSSGKISVQDFQRALIDLDKNGGGGLKSLHNIALDATSGIGNSLENAKIDVVKGLTGVLTAVNKGLSENGLPTISKMIQDAGNSMGQAFEHLAKVIPPAISAIAPFIKACKPIAPLLKTIAVAFVGLGVIAMLAPVLAPVVTVFGALSGVFKRLLGAVGGVGKGIFNLGKNLFGIGSHGKTAGEGLNETASGADKAGESSGKSAGQILAMGTAILEAAIGAAILVGSFALLVTQVTNLAKTGPMGAAAFLAVAAGMSAVIAVMGIVGKMLGSIGPQAAIAYAGMALLVTSFSLLTASVAAFASTGTQGLIALAAVTAAIVAITAVMGAFAPIMEACAAGLLAFGATVVMISAGIAVAAVGIAVLVAAFTGLVNAMTGLAQTGPAGIAVIVALTASIVAIIAVLAILGPLLTASSVGLLAFGAAVLMIGTGVGVAAAGIALLVDALNQAGESNSALGAVVSAVWSAITSFISGAINTIRGVVSGGFNAVRGVISGVMRSVSGIISSVWGTIRGVFNAGVGFIKSVTHFDLSANGRAIMNSFFNGLKSVWESIKSFVGSIAGWIKAHKGPISLDRKLLIPAGQAIMQGLNEGLTNGFKNVQSNVSAMAGAISDAASINVPPIQESAFNKSINAIQTKMQNMSASVDGTITTDNAGMTNVSSRLWRDRMEGLVGVAVDKLDNVDQHPVVTVDTANRLNDYNNKLNANAYAMWNER